MADNPFVIQPPLRANISRAQSIALSIGVVFTALSLLEYFINPTQFFRSWMVGFLFPFALGLGSLACLMLQYMSGGAWGMVIRRQLEAGTRTIPYVTIMFLPILIAVVMGSHALYEWTDPAKVQADPVIRDKSAYLNVTWWVIRAVIVFAIWNLYTFVLNRLSAREEATGDPEISRRLMAWSSIGLVIYVFSLTSAGTDWIMSMNVHWFSTIYGLILLGGQGLTVISLAIISTTLLMKEQPLLGVITKKHLHDLGKLLFMFTLFWTYVSFSQLVIIWSGNLPEEITWYVDRMNGGWEYIGAILLFLQWMLPFLILLSQNIKRNPKTIRFMAIWILCVRLADTIWLVEPNFHSQHLFIDWSDLTAPIGLTGLWAAIYLAQLKQRALIPVNAPDLGKALVHGRAH
jgi:hypothetical protein